MGHPRHSESFERGGSPDGCHIGGPGRTQETVKTTCSMPTSITFSLETTSTVCDQLYDVITLKVGEWQGTFGNLSDATAGSPIRNHLHSWNYTFPINTEYTGKHSRPQNNDWWKDETRKWLVKTEFGWESLRADLPDVVEINRTYPYTVDG